MEPTKNRLQDLAAHWRLSGIHVNVTGACSPQVDRLHHRLGCQRFENIRYQCSVFMVSDAS